jgi:hypothetical protein
MPHGPADAGLAAIPVRAAGSPSATGRVSGPLVPVVGSASWHHLGLHRDVGATGSPVSGGSGVGAAGSPVSPRVAGPVSLPPLLPRTSRPDLESAGSAVRLVGGLPLGTPPLGAVGAPVHASSPVGDGTRSCSGEYGGPESSDAPAAGGETVAIAGTLLAVPGPHLPVIAHAGLQRSRHLGKGAFGDVYVAQWAHHGLMVAVKCNGTVCADVAAIDNERRLYERLLVNPHDNILPVYGICTDAPDGKVRIVMRFCEKGSLDDYLLGTARHEVGCAVVSS